MSPNRILATASLQPHSCLLLHLPAQMSILMKAFLTAIKKKSIPGIVSECLEVGSIMSKSLQETAAKSDVTVVRDGKKQGTYADIAITSAMSAGNAFIGHAKGMAVSATLYVDGKQVNKKTFTRNSSGGMFGAYKSSCAVLNRTSKVLGSDIAQWVVREQKNAQDK